MLARWTQVLAGRRAIGSAGERLVHTEEVTGSIPVSPTRSEYNRALITVMYRTGLRIGEALALKPSDVDLDNGTLRVLHGKGDKARTVGLDAGRSTP